MAAVVSYEQAVEIIAKKVAPLPAVRLQLDECRNGFALAEPVKLDGHTMERGTDLTPTRLMGAEVAGFADLAVYPHPTVGIVAPGYSIEAIWWMIVATGSHTDIPGRHPDKPERVRRLVRDCPLVVYAADADTVADALAEDPWHIRFKGVALAPVDSILLATTKILPGEHRRYMLSIPPDRVGALVGWLMFGTVIVNRLMGRPVDRCQPPRVLAMSSGRLPANGDRTALVPAVLGADEKFSGWHVQPLSPFSGGSEDAALLAEGNALIVRPPGAGALAAKAVCEVIPLDSSLAALR